MSAPTTVTPAISASEVAPFRIASALLTFAASVIADLDSLFGSEPDGGAFTCRGVATSIGANTGTGTGTLTITATGALGAQDGLTYTAGQQLFIQPGTTNVAAIDSGPWTVAVAGTTGVSPVLKRTAWWAHGQTTVPGQRIEIGGEGTKYCNTSWKTTSAAVVVDTTDPAFYVGRITLAATLASGLDVIATGTCPGLLPGAQIECSPTAQSGSLTGTVSYGVKGTGYGAGSAHSFTPGYIGTSTTEVFALATAQATSAGDDSTLAVTFDNGF